MDADDVVDVLIEERRAGHAGDADLLGHFQAEVHVGLALAQVRADVGQHEVRALRIGKGDADLLQTVGEQLLHVGVVIAEFLVVAVRHVEADHSGLHQRRRRADGIEVVVLLDAVHDGLRRDGVAETPAGDGVGLGKARAADRALPHAGQAVHIDVLVALVDNVLIHLVHDGERVILDAQLRDELQLVVSEHLAGGVRRVADEDGLCALFERVFQHVCIEVERRRDQRDEDRFTVSHDGLRAVVLKIRGEHDDLVAGVRQGEDRIDHGLGRADGHDHIRLRIERAAHEAAGLAGKRLPEIRRAHGDGVLVRAERADLRQTVRQGLGRVKVGEALRQVDRAARKCHARHAPDDGIGE